MSLLQVSVVVQGGAKKTAARHDNLSRSVQGRACLYWSEGRNPCAAHINVPEAYYVTVQTALVSSSTHEIFSRSGCLLISLRVSGLFVKDLGDMYGLV